MSIIDKKLTKNFLNIIHIYIMWGDTLKTLGIIAIIWLSLCAFILLILHIKSHKMIKSIFLNALLGFLAIIVINLTQKFTGVSVPVNWWTVGGGGIFGLPCICGIILAQII